MPEIKALNTRHVPPLLPVAVRGHWMGLLIQEEGEAD
jgi:hypothetical protein